MKKFLRVLGNIIFALIIILMTIGLMGNLSAKSDKVYNIIKYRTYIIVSPSMKPTSNTGDLIFFVLCKKTLSNLYLTDMTH